MADTTVTTVLESVPTIIASALLELNDIDIVGPLVTEIPFPGPGYIHQTPFVNRLVAETDDDLASQALEMSSSDEVSPSAATVGAHGAYVQLKDLATLASNSDLAAIAGQLIGQCLAVRKEVDLIALFSSFLTNQGSVSTAGLAPADLYDAYGSLRSRYAPLPYHLVLNPLQIWATLGLVVLFDNSSDAVQSAGVGTVGEDWARNGFSGMVMGFNLWADANISFTAAETSLSIGAAFSRGAIKSVSKRGLMVEVQRYPEDVSDNICGSDFRGEAILRNRHGNKMQFPLA